MSTPFGKTFSTLAMLALTSSLGAQTIGMGDPTTPQPVATQDSPSLRLGPVDGLTTAWHTAPAHFAVPQGSELMFEFAWDEPHLLTWTGAQTVSVSATTAQAQAFMDDLGSQQIAVSATSPEGEFLTGWILDVEVLAPEAFEAEVPLPELFHYAPTVDPSAPVLQNGVTAVPIFLDRGPRKIVGYGGTLGASAYDAPQVLQPLLEWRLDGEVVGLGPAADMLLDDHGSYLLEVGPPGSAGVVNLIAPEQHALPDGWTIGGANPGGGIGCNLCPYPIKCGATKALVGGPGFGFPAVVVRNNSSGKAGFDVTASLSAYSSECETWQVLDAASQLPNKQPVVLDPGQVSVVYAEGISDCDLQLFVKAEGLPASLVIMGQEKLVICQRKVWTQY